MCKNSICLLRAHKNLYDLSDIPYKTIANCNGPEKKLGMKFPRLGALRPHAHEVYTSLRDPPLYRCTCHIGEYVMCEWGLIVQGNITDPWTTVTYYEREDTDFSTEQICLRFNDVKTALQMCNKNKMHKNAQA